MRLLTGVIGLALVFGVINGILWGVQELAYSGDNAQIAAMESQLDAEKAGLGSLGNKLDSEKAQLDQLEKQLDDYKAK